MKRSTFSFGALFLGVASARPAYGVRSSPLAAPAAEPNSSLRVRPVCPWSDRDTGNPFSPARTYIIGSRRTTRRSQVGRERREGRELDARHLVRRLLRPLRSRADGPRVGRGCEAEPARSGGRELAGWRHKETDPKRIVVGDPVGERHALHPPQHVPVELEVAAAPLVAERQLAPPALCEPCNLVVELAAAQRGQGARQAGVLGGGAKPLAREGLVVGVALAVDVEVAERDQVLVEVGGLVGPAPQPARHRTQLSGALRGALAVDDMQRHEDEGLTRAQEADRVRGARELALKGVVSHRALAAHPGRQHKLAGEARWLRPPRVYRNASRSPCPSSPRFSSISRKPQAGPSTLIRWRSDLMFACASCSATTSKRETTSAIRRSEKRSRSALSPLRERHFSVRSPNSRRFQVATRMLRPRRLEGIR